MADAHVAEGKAVRAHMRVKVYDTKLVGSGAAGGLRLDVVFIHIIDLGAIVFHLFVDIVSSTLNASSAPVCFTCISLAVVTVLAKAAQGDRWRNTCWRTIREIWFRRRHSMIVLYTPCSGRHILLFHLLLGDKPWT